MWKMLYFAHTRDSRSKSSIKQNMNGYLPCTGSTSAVTTSALPRPYVYLLPVPISERTGNQLHKPSANIALKIS